MIIDNIILGKIYFNFCIFDEKKIEINLNLEILKIKESFRSRINTLINFPITQKSNTFKKLVLPEIYE
jgi:hypothetical protein